MDVKVEVITVGDRRFTDEDQVPADVIDGGRDWLKKQ